jgi:hypothetical protein
VVGGRLSVLTAKKSFDERFSTDGPTCKFRLATDTGN